MLSGYSDGVSMGPVVPGQPSFVVSYYIPEMGDADYDSRVTIRDFRAWLRGYTSGYAPSVTRGDFDYSGTADLTDFKIWFRHYAKHGGKASTVQKAVESADLSRTQRSSILKMLRRIT